MDPAELFKQLGIDLVKDAENLEQVSGEYEFKMFTRDAQGGGGLLKTFVEKDEEGEDQFFIAGTASSTIKDRHGDTMLPSALIDMERQANDNLTIFLNHEYRVPEDVAGSVEKASIQSSATDPETGAPIYDLAFERVRINKANPRAVDSWKALNGTGKNPKGVKLGLSIGARIPEGGAVRNKKTGALLIAHVDLLETSIVSIPANPRSWIDAAVKSLRGAPAQTINASLDIPADGTVSATITASAEPQAPPPPSPEPPPAPTPEPAAKADEPVVVASTSPSQGAPASEPGADGGASPDVAAAATPPDPIDVSKASTPELIDALRSAQKALGDTTLELIEARKDLAAAEAARLAVEKERDAVKEIAKDVISDTAQIIDRIGRLPVGQKASFKAIKRDFDDIPDSLSDIYSPGFLAELKRGTDT